MLIKIQYERLMSINYQNFPNNEYICGLNFNGRLQIIPNIISFKQNIKPPLHKPYNSQEKIYQNSLFKCKIFLYFHVNSVIIQLSLKIIKNHLNSFSVFNQSNSITCTGIEGFFVACMVPEP